MAAAGNMFQAFAFSGSAANTPSEQGVLARQSTGHTQPTTQSQRLPARPRKRVRSGQQGTRPTAPPAASPAAPPPGGLPEKLGLGSPLRLVFVGHNPSEHAWRSGHYYSNPSNRMWRVLATTGIAPLDAGPLHDDALPQSRGVGFTDVGAGQPGTDRCARIPRVHMGLGGWRMMSGEEAVSPPPPTAVVVLSHRDIDTDRPPLPHHSSADTDLPADICPRRRCLLLAQQPHTAHVSAPLILALGGVAFTRGSSHMRAPHLIV